MQQSDIFKYTTTDEGKTHGGEIEILSFWLFTASTFYFIKTENISIISYSFWGALTLHRTKKKWTGSSEFVNR